MSEMLERVAKAIEAEIDKLEEYDREAMYPETLKVLARAAIEAMRDPTAAMTAAAWREAQFEDNVDGVWRAMVDAALAGEKAPA